MGHKNGGAGRFWLECAVVAALAGVAGAQAPAGAPTKDEPSIRIKKTVRLVEVEVIAKDKKGVPVTGLELKDFTLRDNGREQKISLFAAQQGSAPAQVAAVAKEAKEQKKEEEAEPVRSFSNERPAAAGPVVILMDLLNTAPENQPGMKRALLASLKRMKVEGPVALLILGDDLRLVSDFTMDANALAALIEKPAAIRPEGVGPAITAPRTSSEKFNEIILAASVKEFNREAGDRVDRTIHALNLVRSQLSRMRGRKSLIWIGGGMMVMPDDWPLVRSAVDQFNDADVAVYTVDARGVLMGPGDNAEIDPTDMMGPWNEEQAETRGDILDTVARSTGGVPYRNTNALDRAITRAVEDNVTVYTLGYYPAHDDWQGRPHKIEVKVARAGVQLRYRTGYMATAAATAEAADQQQSLTAIAASPIEFPGMRFRVDVKAGNQGNDLHLTLHVPASEIRFSMEEEKLVGALQLWYIQRRASGADLTSKTSSFSFSLTPAEYQAAVDHGGLTLASVLRVSENTAKVRVLLRDHNSGRVGTVDVPVAGLIGGKNKDEDDE